MPYPAAMQASIKKVKQSRKARINQDFSSLQNHEKTNLLETYHPDFKSIEKREIQVGINKGTKAPQELVALLDSPSRLSSESIDLNKVAYKTDILVIGCGGGGVTAALTAQENGAEVLLATKLRLGDSNTIMAEGGIGAATLPDDSPAIHYVDTMAGGRFKNISDLVEALVTDAPYIIDWLSDLGVNFDRLADGSYFTHMPAGHSRRRSHSVKDITGLEIMRVLSDEVRNRKINILEFCPAVELLLDDRGQCAGAVLFNFDTEQYFLVEAKVVILATGGMGRLHPLGFPTSNHYGATADGLVMANRAGAKLIFVGSVQYHPTGAAWPEQMLGLLISEAVRAQGAQVVNCNGEQFVNRLETRDALSATILRECGEIGKGVVTPTGMVSVWLDTPLVDLIDGDGTFIHRFAGIYSRLKKYGIDPVREPILVYPTQHYQNGGVLINTHGETNVPNLYTVGEASGGVHGHNRLGSNSLQDIFVFGRRAGVHAAQKTQNTNLDGLSLEHVKAHSRILQKAGIDSGKISPLLLPDYRFEKALPTFEHQK